MSDEEKAISPFMRSVMKRVREKRKRVSSLCQKIIRTHSGYKALWKNV